MMLGEQRKIWEISVNLVNQMVAVHWQRASRFPEEMYRRRDCRRRQCQLRIIMQLPEAD